MKEYYTPTIDEFHIGFEYEYTLLAGWRSNTFQLDSNIQALEQAINAGYIRVKHLDSEDIESVGWEYFAQALNGLNFKLGRYFLAFYNEDNNIIIDDGGPRYDSETYFQGTIRNISELKKLMKQLNIQRLTLYEGGD